MDHIGIAEETGQLQARFAEIRVKMIPFNKRDIFTLLGLLMLIGLVAKNAILVVDFTNHLKAEGIELKAALLEATRKRFRPIIMTTLTTVVSMLPVALAQGAGADWKNGLAWVVIGGMTSSMFLTLVVVPLVYYLVDRIMIKFGWHTNRKIVTRGRHAIPVPASL